MKQLKKHRQIVRITFFLVLFLCAFLIAYYFITKNTSAICYHTPPNNPSNNPISEASTHTAQTEEEIGEYEMKILIVEDHGTSLFAIPLHEKDYQSPFFVSVPDSFQKNTVSLSSENPSNTNKRDSLEGMIATIHWNGMVQETYPAQIGATTIDIKEKSASPLFLYLDALKELIQTDAALQNSITQAVFCLDGIDNLTALEKEALTYVGGSYLNVFGTQGTFEQLEKDNQIQDGTFTDGIYIEIIGKNLNKAGTKVQFSMEKYRSPLGAYFFSDCIGTYKNDSWNYTIGSHIIS